MEITATSARLKLPRSRYAPESLNAGALAVGRAAKVFLDRKGADFVVELVCEEKTSRAALRALAGIFLNECLSHQYRQKVIAFHAKLTAAALAPVFSRVFEPLPADPLEELEPQVRLDRDGETNALLGEAREMK